MKTLIALIVWVTVNGFPVKSFDSCALAEAKAAELRQQLPDLRVRAECDAAHKPEAKATIDYYGPRRTAEAGEENQ